MKIYTRTGDRGETGLFGGARVRKNDPRVEAYGTIDELNAQLGLCHALVLPALLEPVVLELQGQLFTLGAEVACQPEATAKLRLPLIDEAGVMFLEQTIDEHEAHLPALTQFILPGGSPAAASLHVARTICRRAERRCQDVADLRPLLTIYLNRLSDLLFVLARRASYLGETKEILWNGRVTG